MGRCVRARLRIYGLVQGVFFRSSMQSTALRLGVVGWVRNLPDGSVEAVVEGEVDKVEELIKWCRKGPPTAIVKRVDAEYSECINEFKTFSVRR
ncbi:MAG: acylphosphatase [Zestosphaera sp.]